jgi:glycosyltransferase involved in cell wall biosynthesis
MKKKVLVTASVASMIDLFNMDNIQILQDMGYEVEVATNFQFGSITSQERVDEFRDELEIRGILTYHVPIPRSIKNIAAIIQSYKQMRKLCGQKDYAIVHTQSPIGGVVARLAASKSRKKGTRVIYTAHGFHFFRGASWKNWLLFYPIEKWMSYVTDDLITINQEDFRIAQSFFARRVHYVPGIGVDATKQTISKESKLRKREEFHLNVTDFVLVSVGQLSKRKNQGMIIEAMAQIKQPNIKYLIVGIGEMEGQYRKRIKELHLEERIILAGYRRDIPDILSAADCFVFPSLQEGLPVSLMEAMSAGLPIICSNIRGNIDLITNEVEGLVVAENDALQYALAINDIYEKREKTEGYIRAAREKLTLFSKAAVCKRMEEIYRSENE